MRHLFFGCAFFVAFVRDNDFRLFSENLNSLCEGFHNDRQGVEHIAHLFAHDAIADVDVIVPTLVVEMALGAITNQWRTAFGANEQAVEFRRRFSALMPRS